MPLTDFEKYNQEMNHFRKSVTFRKFFNKFMNLIKGFSKTCIKSKAIERCFSIRGGQVRALVNHARREGVPIGSSHDGYFYAKNFSEIEGTIKHLEERAREMLFLASRLKKAFPENSQVELFEKEFENV